MAGYRNNNLQNAGADLEPGELSKFTNYALDVFEITPPDLHDAADVRRAILEYFNTCDARGIRPGNMGLYGSLGLSKQQAHNIITGRDKAKVSPESRDLIKKARYAMSAYREGLVLEGKINPVTYIFMGKNFDGLEDQAKIEVSTDRADALQLTQEELRKRIPVYDDAEQIDGTTGDE